MKRFQETSRPITADNFRYSLAHIGINQSAFARWIGVDGRTVRLWLAGKWPVPLAVGYLVQLMVRTNTRPEDLT